MRRIILSGFADEAAVRAEDQMDVLEKNGVRHIEMRNVDGKHVLEHTDGELRALGAKLRERGFGISAIGSPVGKSPITDGFAPALELFKKAAGAALILGCRYVRGFSFYTPKGEDPWAYAGEALQRLGELVGIAEANGLVYALENESGLFADIPERIGYVFDNIRSESLAMAFDPGNFIFSGAEPVSAYEKLKKRVAYFHIKDARRGAEHFCPCGEGDADMERLLAEAYGGGFSGYLSIEPHLGYMENLSDAQRFTAAADALKATLGRALGPDLEMS
ncbi:MAG: sugar phosphate isomerase/epimerase [Firmicutes bacterium]|nr:sugar phosphate isomerase/epimerase [Bacillota bacterium]